MCCVTAILIVIMSSGKHQRRVYGHRFLCLASDKLSDQILRPMWDHLAQIINIMKRKMHPLSNKDPRRYFVPIETQTPGRQARRQIRRKQSLWSPPEVEGIHINYLWIWTYKTFIKFHKKIFKFFLTFMIPQKSMFQLLFMCALPISLNSCVQESLCRLSLVWRIFAQIL